MDGCQKGQALLVYGYDATALEVWEGWPGIDESIFLLRGAAGSCGEAEASFSTTLPNSS